MDTNPKILLVQLYANGDCLYTTAVARQIKTEYPNCILTWAVSPGCKNILLLNPYIDHILEINEVKRDDTAAFRKFLSKIANSQYGIFDKTFVTQVIGKNLANYDGCIRSSIFRGYPGTITVPIQPVLVLSEDENAKVRLFALQHQLSDYKNVILFEYAPQSGQSNMDFQMALSIATELTASKDTAIILSSANKFESDSPFIIDGSVLSIRETAGLTHQCTLLLGSSSGLTWASTSSAATMLPMIQLLNADSKFINAVSRDFKRFNIDDTHLIELTHFDQQKIVACVQMAIKNFANAKNSFNQQIPIQFNSSRSIVYNLLCYLEFRQIIKHIKINRSLFGDRFSLYKNIFLGFLITPFKLVKNLFTKRIKPIS